MSYPIGFLIKQIKMKTVILILLIFTMSVSCYSQSRHFINYGRNLNAVIKEKEIDTNNLSLIIDKSDYKLTVLGDSVVLKEYPVVFGANSTDDKLMQGDKCTPEGLFYMKIKYPHSKWSKFIWLNYPTEDSWRKHNYAVRQGKIPEDSKIGGEIGIHGVPTDMDFMIDLHYNWTAGCVSMKNKDMDEIYKYITKSTPVIIKK